MCYRVGVVHASPLMRRAFRDLFDSHAALEHGGSAQRMSEVGHLLRSQRPHVLLIEHEQFRDNKGLDASALHEATGVRIVIYGRACEPQAVLESLQRGAVGFVHYSCGPDEIVRGFLDVLGGRTFLHLGQSESGGPRNDLGKWFGADALTPREHDVFQMLLLRRSNDEIAEELCITRQTVKNYASNVFRKLGVGGRRELLRGESFAGAPHKPARTARPRHLAPTRAIARAG
jgi:two-component system response regulator DevR